MASIHTYETGAGRRYVVRWREGKAHRGKTFIRKRDALSYKGDLVRREQLGELYEDEAGSLAEFLHGWEVRYALRVRESSAARRQAALRALPAPLLAQPLAGVRAADVEDAVTAIAIRAPRQGQLALASLKLALKDAVKRGLRFDRRILELSPPKPNGRTPRFLTWKEVEYLASLMPNDSYNRLVRVAALTGLRRGEILALKWEDVDLDKQVLRVREGKTEAARRAIDLSLRATRILRVQKGRQGDPERSAPVFPNNQGGHHDPGNFYSRVFLPAVRAAEMDGLTLHDLRHTHASLLAAANVNPKVAAHLLGHADGGALFLRRYSHLYPGVGRQAAEALEASL